MVRILMLRWLAICLYVSHKKLTRLKIAHTRQTNSSVFSGIQTPQYWFKNIVKTGHIVESQRCSSDLVSAAMIRRFVTFAIVTESSKTVLNG